MPETAINRLSFAIIGASLNRLASIFPRERPVPPQKLSQNNGPRTMIEEMALRSAGTKMMQGRLLPTNQLRSLMIQ